MIKEVALIPATCEPGPVAAFPSGRYALLCDGAEIRVVEIKSGIEGVNSLALLENLTYRMRQNGQANQKYATAALVITV